MISALKQIRFGGLILLWLIALAIFAVRAPAFFSLANFTSILQFSTLLALVTLGQTFVILTGGGGIDLSVGGIVSLSGLSMAFLMKQGTPVFVAATVGILFGGMLGSINGLIITRLRLLPLIVTLGTYYAYNGLALALTGGAPITGLPSSFSILGQGAVLAVPLHTLVFVMPIFVVLMFILTQTPLGRWIYAIGSNERASRLVGLPVNAIRLGVYILSGLLAALAGLVADSWLLSARPNIGENLELLSLTATLLGGTSIFGGSGGLAGSLVAVLFFTSLQVGLQMLNINSIWQLGVVGLFLIGTVLLDRTLRTAEKK
ncbi:MAG TPA: ABC transporter permease [Chthoniobacterales bacterium]|jgi:ribose/xylose/arabinose/galactoside ABC-type transport system permease subunit|nr:ABC transporter permease [Chthoniobacterales bacterium]